MSTLGDLGENELIRRLAPLLPGREDVRVGIGDDCAVVSGGASGWDFVMTTDPVIEGVHFLPSDAPERVGRKAVGRALSDIAAMGGEPLWLLVDLVAPAAAEVARIEAVYRGAAALAARFGAAIIGGDTAQGDQLELHVFGVGRVPSGSALLRSGARPGDQLYVTGELGGSRKGRHLDVEPRLAEAAWLRDGRWATAMMDLSDGLAADLPRLLSASRVGAVLDLGAVPIAAAAGGSLEAALSDGEDFELLFAVSAERVSAFERAWAQCFALSCARIGHITDQAGALLGSRDGKVFALLAKGFEHFRS